MVRNIIFSIVFFSGIILISLIFLPALLLPQSIVLIGGKLMGYWASLCLRTILSIKIKILGKENIIKDKKFFIAASHQSMFETFYLQTIFNYPIFFRYQPKIGIKSNSFFKIKTGELKIV